MSAPRRTIACPTRKGECVIVYRPRDITLDMMDRAQTDPLDAAVGLICGAVASWNLVQEDDRPYPLTERRVWELPQTFILDAAAAITRDLLLWRQEQMTRETA